VRLLLISGKQSVAGVPAGFQTTGRKFGMSQDVSSIGQMVPVERLQAANRQPKTPAASPAAPQAMTLVPTTKHTVQAGETLTSIAQKYQANKPADMDMEAWIMTIQVTNGLGDRDTIKVGQVLSIPQLSMNGETLETTVPQSQGPYDPEKGLTFPPGAQGKAPTGTTTPDPAVKTETPPAWRTEVVTAAKDTLGTKYVWGGTNLNKGVDCSGLTQQVFDQIGVDLPRTSGEQFKAGGQAVQRADLQPGDLIFFRNTKGRICHVGIYSGTDDKDRQLYISATTSKGVAEVAIDDWTRWNRAQRYAGARRFEAPKTP
jgi:cell wall-associated NlpC family hydrolase